MAAGQLYVSKDFESVPAYDELAYPSVGEAVTTKHVTPAEVASEIFAELGKRNLDAALALVADDSVDDFVAIGEVSGKVAIRGFFEELLAAFPDFVITVGRILADEEAAVVQWRSVGTFSGGPFQGIEPTGRHVEIRGVDVMEIAGGLVRHNTIYYDGASFARQIGMLPRAHSTADRTMMSTFNAVTRVRHRLAKYVADRRGA
jgi:steroid delta-isomerase-like uncharacterized protein